MEGYRLVWRRWEYGGGDILVKRVGLRELFMVIKDIKEIKRPDILPCLHTYCITMITMTFEPCACQNKQKQQAFDSDDVWSKFSGFSFLRNWWTITTKILISSFSSIGQIHEDILQLPIPYYVTYTLLCKLGVKTGASVVKYTRPLDKAFLLN